MKLKLDPGLCPGGYQSDLAEEETELGIHTDKHLLKRQDLSQCQAYLKVENNHVMTLKQGTTVPLSPANSGREAQSGLCASQRGGQQPMIITSPSKLPINLYMFGVQEQDG